MNQAPERPAALTEPMGSLPGTMRREMARIGPIWASDIPKHRDLVLAAYAPLLAQAPKAGVTVEADLAYGEHPRQRLDVYRAQYKRPTPVVIFAHGGAFVRGNKSVNDEVYANVLYY